MGEALLRESGNFTEIIGYHGTSLENGQNICASKTFKCSDRDNYLGSGVYFFIEGLKEPRECAKDWAVVRADKGFRPKAYDDGVILECTLHVPDENLIDFRKIEYLQLFNQVKAVIRGKLPEEKCTDADIFEYMTSKLNVLAYIYIFYIKYKYEKAKKESSRIPNSVVLTVVNPDYGHVIKSIEQISEFKC